MVGRLCRHLFSRKKRTKVVRASAENGGAQASRTQTRGPETWLDWHKRNFLTEVLIPSLFTKRSGDRAMPLFPKVGPSEVCITWIGHASFLIQLAGMNVLIDPELVDVAERDQTAEAPRLSH